MNFPATFAACCLMLVLCSCNARTSGPDTSVQTPDSTKSLSQAAVGTWKLIDGTLIEKGDTVVNDYTRKLAAIKIITATHFSFLQHGLKGGADSAVFASGGGRYQLSGDQYTEHLEFCSDRQWEGHDFTFTISVANDTLIQRGTEKIESLGVDRLNTERYVRVSR